MLNKEKGVLPRRSNKTNDDIIMETILCLHSQITCTISCLQLDLFPQRSLVLPHGFPKEKGGDDSCKTGPEIHSVCVSVFA